MKSLILLIAILSAGFSSYAQQVTVKPLDSVAQQKNHASNAGRAKVDTTNYRDSITGSNNFHSTMPIKKDRNPSAMPVAKPDSGIKDKMPVKHIKVHHDGGN